MAHQVREDLGDGYLGRVDVSVERGVTAQVSGHLRAELGDRQLVTRVEVPLHGQTVPACRLPATVKLAIWRRALPTPFR